MFVLIAHGTEARQRWRHSLEQGQTYVLGRDVQCDLPVPWDASISRQHARLRLANGGVEIEKVPEAHNAVFFQGAPATRLTMKPGQHCVIGSTKFQLAAAQEFSPSASDEPVEEVTFDRRDLQKVSFRDADRRFDVLTRLHEVIWGARTEPELHQRLTSLILAGVRNSEAVAIVAVDSRGQSKILHWDRRREAEGAFHASTRLIVDALHRRKRTVLHVRESAKQTDSKYTVSAEFDWAYCSPLASQAGEALGLYVAGAIEGPLSPSHPLRPEGLFLQADVKFTELVAEIVQSVLRLNSYERQKAGLRQFFAPPILAALGDDLNTSLLEPRECEVTVLFCDLRGFSKKAEAEAGDLRGLLDRVSLALGMMTREILQHGGVTGDFQGDSAMGFWGWPFATEDSPIAACRAALAIRAAFAQTFQQPDHPLADFQVGLGLAHGRAVAGKIGTAEQVKVTVFGPVVNLASRLEGATKSLRVPIAIDESLAAIVKARMDAGEGRTRKLAKLLPYGTEKPFIVSELVPAAQDAPELTDEHLRLYDRAVEHFIDGRWDAAYRDLHGMPPGDRAQDFLSATIAQHNRNPPPGWNGVTVLTAK